MAEKKKNRLLEKNKKLRWLWFIALLIFPVFLWMIPSDFFDEGKVILCPSRFLFDVECFGCGMTRAIMHLHHFELEDAVYFNQFSVVVYPALVIIWFIWVRSNVKELGLLKQLA
ncbi:MAG: hypothetical protein ACI8P3_002405 [Saprospiraceae bacterium]|jgi:hypothetical protein